MGFSGTGTACDLAAELYISRANDVSRAPRVKHRSEHELWLMKSSISLQVPRVIA